MENGAFILIIVAGVGLLLGTFIGYLLGSRKDSGIAAEKAAAEARSTELERQIKQRDFEIQKRDEQIERNQEKLVVAESAKTKAETELSEALESLKSSATEIQLKKDEIASVSNSNISLMELNAELTSKNESLTERLDEQKNFLEEADTKLREAFEALSSEALRKNNFSFLELAKETLDGKVTESKAEFDLKQQAIETLVKPLGESLTKFDEKLGEIELKREGAYSEMKTLIDAMKTSTESLNTGTSQLVSALKTSHVRGKYGEISLRRVVEVAGLSPYCDFDEQVSVNVDGGKLRPDMTVNLPGHRQLILDSKVPLAAYMRAFETDVEAERIELMKDHAAAVRKHLKDLSNKSYWDQFDEAPDFVIMYLQIESSFGAALMSDPSLIEDGINAQIVLATPSTLITMLRTVGFMWQQERMAESIYEMRDAAVLLYKRANTMLEHFSRIGSGLNTAIDSYNKTIGSMETRVIPQLDKIKEIGGTLANEELPEIKPVETVIRPIAKTIATVEIIERDETFPAIPSLND